MAKLNQDLVQPHRVLDVDKHCGIFGNLNRSVQKGFYKGLL